MTEEETEIEKMIENSQSDAPKKERTLRRSLYHQENYPLCDVLENMHDEYKKDCEITYANVGEVVMKVPAIKQKWVSRFCKYRNTAADVERQLKMELEKETKKIIEGSPVAMTQLAAQKAAQKSESRKIVLLTERLHLLNRINDDLSEILKHVHFLNTEVASIVEYIKMENS